MKKVFILLFSVIFSISCFAQERNKIAYTINSVNGSDKHSICIGIKKTSKAHGSIIYDNERICWNKPTDYINVTASDNGNNYTFYASAYFNPKNAMIKEKYAYIKYLRNVTLGGKGADIGKYVDFTDYMIRDTLLINVFKNQIDEKHYYDLIYVDENYKVIRVHTNPYDNTSFYVTKKQLEDLGIKPKDGKYDFEGIEYNSNGLISTVINSLTVQILK